VNDPILHRMVGEVNGKLDTLLVLVRDHVEQDDKRFAEVDAELKDHAADINKAKGAKAATLALAGAAATVVSLAVAAAGKFF
jgi:malate/lactate dehydrogenase